MASLLIDIDAYRDWTSSFDVVPVDVRDHASYLSGHLPGAVSVPDLYEYNASTTLAGEDDLRAHFEGVLGRVGLSGSERVVVYEGAMNSGLGRSCRGQVLLHHLGFPDPRVLNGGLAAWRDRGLPVDVGEVNRSPVRCSVSMSQASPMVTKAQVLATLDSPDVIRVDVRDREEWECVANTPHGVDDTIRVGRLPHARWLPWTDLLDVDGAVPRLLPAQQVRERCEAAAGAALGSPIQLYCYKGARAGCAYVALHEAGYSDVTLYLGSWREWGADPTLPIEVPVGLEPG
jgi:thiosulfate/3-mercaptopyruvate sulfurtransferase